MQSSKSDKIESFSEPSLDLIEAKNTLFNNHSLPSTSAISLYLIDLSGKLLTSPGVISYNFLAVSFLLILSDLKHVAQLIWAYLFGPTLE